MSQAEFFAACGASRAAQYNFERDVNLPGGAYLIAAADHGVDVKYVLTGTRGVERVVLPLDKALLIDCIEGVDRYLRDIGETLDGQTKAELVAHVYEEFRARGGATRAKVLEFVKRAA